MLQHRRGRCQSKLRPIEFTAKAAKHSEEETKFYFHWRCTTLKLGECWQCSVIKEDRLFFASKTKTWRIHFVNSLMIRPLKCFLNIFESKGLSSSSLHFRNKGIRLFVM